VSKYVYTSGEVWGEQPPDGPSPLPPDTSRAGERLARRARLARRVPGWAGKTKEEKDHALRLAAIDERNERRWREDR